jgi:hypothetical protein
MATKSIGTGGDYTTIQAWEDSLLETLTEAEVGQLKNQSFTAGVTFSGITTSATNTITLECETGASFRDHANKATNPLYPNSSYGAIITLTGSYATAPVVFGVNYLKLKNLQILCTGVGTFCVVRSGAPTNTTIDSCLIAGRPAGTDYVVRCYDSLTITNTLVANIGSGGNGLHFAGGASGVCSNVTVARTTNSSTSGTGILGNYSPLPLIKNTAIFGFTNADSSWNASSDYNGTSDSTLATGSNNQTSLTYANQFENTGATAANSDFRLKAGANLIDTGTSSGMPSVDVVNQTRSGSYDIGAWEVQSAATGNPWNYYAQLG